MTDAALARLRALDLIGPCRQWRGMVATMWLPWPMGEHACNTILFGMTILALNIVVLVGAVLWRLWQWI